MQNFSFEPLVNLTRGSIVESVHLGVLVISDASGNIIFSVGNPNLSTYPRSSMKPFQALPFIEKGGRGEFNLTPEEVAIMCASHSGTDEHVRVIKSIHSKAKLSLENLMCGVHYPSDKPTADAMRARNEQPTAYHHNCSGKHSGMLAHARLEGLPLENYLSMQHPVQQSIIKAVADMCDMLPGQFPIGLDGCSAPVFAMPLKNFALALARLCDPVGFPEERASACRYITSAMSSYPTMVAGPGKMDTMLMETMQGKVNSKGGAEGYQALGILPGAFGAGSPALGIAIKISDGDQTRRALDCLTVEVLKGLGLLNPDEISKLLKFGNKPLTNWRGLTIGEIKPAFDIPSFRW